MGGATAGLGLIPVIGWGGMVVLASAATGFSWALQPIQLPLIWLLVLTFVPTAKIQDFLKTRLKASKKEQ